MAESRRKLAKIEVVATITKQSADRSQRKDIAAIVDQYLANLLSGLGITKAGDFRIKTSNVESNTRLLEVRIDGFACRIPKVQPNTLETDLQLLGRQVCEALAVSRVLLVTTDVVADATEQMFDKGDARRSEISADTMTLLAEQLVAGGHGLHKLERLPTNVDELSLDATALAEKIIGDPLHASIDIEYCEAYRPTLDTADIAGRSLAKMTESMRKSMFDSLGLIVPVVKWHSESNLPADSFQIQIHDLTLPLMRGLSIDQYVVDLDVSKLSLFDISATPIPHPVRRSEQSLINASEAETCVGADLFVYGVGGYMVLCLNSSIRHFAGAFVGESVVSNSLDLLAELFPRLVAITRSSWGDLKLTQVVRDLAQSGISIRDFRTILETLLHVNGTMPIDFHKNWVAFAECEHIVPSRKSSIEDLDAAELSDYVRAFGLQKQIFYNVANDQGKPTIFVVSTATSDRIRDAKSRPLSVAEKESILESVDRLVGDEAFADINPIVMTDYATRRTFQELIRIEYPELRVCSWQEMLPTCEFKILGTIQA